MDHFGNEWCNEMLRIQVVSKLVVSLFKVMYLLILAKGSGFLNIRSILQVRLAAFSPRTQRSPYKIQDPASVLQSSYYRLQHTKMIPSADDYLTMYFWHVFGYCRHSRKALFNVIRSQFFRRPFIVMVQRSSYPNNNTGLV